MQNLWEHRGLRVHSLGYPGRMVGYLSRDEEEESWRRESARGTGEQEVAQPEALESG